jgi:hypothetical protein
MSSLLTRIIWEAESSVVEFVEALKHDAGLRVILRERGLHAAARQAELLRRHARTRPNGPGEAGPVVTGDGDTPGRAGNAFPHGVGTPISNNSPGQSDVW